MSDLFWNCSDCAAGIEVVGRDYAARSEIRAFKTAHTAEHWAVMPVEEMP